VVKIAKFVEVEINGSKTATIPNDELTPIRLGLIQLIHYRKLGCSPKPAELEWEIRLYEWIINHPQAKEIARLYIDERRKSNFSNDKREIAKKLGWEIS
jgi:hypothetical protein